MYDAINAFFVNDDNFAGFFWDTAQECAMELDNARNGDLATSTFVKQLASDMQYAVNSAELSAERNGLPEDDKATIEWLSDNMLDTIERLRELARD